jgi:hypothetical protein
VSVRCDECGAVLGGDVPVVVVGNATTGEDDGGDLCGPCALEHTGAGTCAKCAVAVTEDTGIAVRPEPDARPSILWCRPCAGAPPVRSVA